MHIYYKFVLILTFAISLIGCGGVGAGAEETESPIAKNDVSVLKGDKPKIISVLDNDSDPDGDIDNKTIVIETPPNHGEAVPNSSGEITYTPKKGYSGSDSFTYTVKDMDGLISAPATVNITIEKIPASLIVDKPAPHNIDNDGNGELSKGDLLTYTITATNTGSSLLTNVEISDPMLIPSSKICASVAPDDNCILSGTYTIKAQDVVAGKIDNTATANSDQTGSESDSETVLLLSPSLAVEKLAPEHSDDDDNGEFSEGDVLTYTITATNSGGATLTNIVISDLMISLDSKICALVAPEGTCVLTGDYTITAADVTEGEIENTATANSDQTDQSSDTNKIVVPKPAMLTLAKATQNAPAVKIDFTLIATDPDGKKFDVTVNSGQNETLTIIKHGEYTLSENTLLDYIWESLSCTNAIVDGTDVSGVTKENPNVSLKLGDEVTCTFTNKFEPRPFKMKVRVYNYYVSDSNGVKSISSHTNNFDSLDYFSVPSGDKVGFHFEIPTDNTLTYDYDVDCGSENAPNGSNVTGDFVCVYDNNNPMKTDTNIPYKDYVISISGLFPKLDFFNQFAGSQATHFDNNKIISIEQWGSVEWQSMKGAFYGTHNLREYNALDKPNLNNKVIDMSYMFYNSAFDQDIGGWDVSNITDMSFMFARPSFSPSIGSAPLSTENYDHLLQGWSELDLQTGVIFDAGQSKSSPESLSAKGIILNEKSWIIYDGDNPYPSNNF